MLMQIITAPLIGALIGYLTNRLAIKMLFRPRQAKFLAGRQLPFTPGLIPKRREQIARKVGQVVSEQLLNQEALQQALLAEDSKRKLQETIDRLMAANSANQKTGRQLLIEFYAQKNTAAVSAFAAQAVPDVAAVPAANSAFVAADAADSSAFLAAVPVAAAETAADNADCWQTAAQQADLLVERLTGQLARVVAAELQQAGLGETAAALVLDYLNRKMPGSGRRSDSGGALNGLGGFLGGLFADHSFSKAIAARVASTVEGLVAENAEEVAARIIRAELDKYLDASVAELLEHFEGPLASGREKLLQLYPEVVKAVVQELLQLVNIAEVVEQQIGALDLFQLEDIIYDVCERELKAITYLGGLLGALLGFLNVFINWLF